MKRIYLDHAAATPVEPRVRRAMAHAMNVAGNPSSFNDAGREAAALLDRARADVARFLNAQPEEVIFTSSGSEANTLAIQGLCAGRKGEIITSPIEHASVLENVRACKQGGLSVSMLAVDGEGSVSPEELEQKLSPTTLLVSVMYANNEIGTIEPVKAIGKIIRAYRTKHRTAFPFFHIDACQAAEYLPMDVQRLGADLLTFNGAKVYGPRGIGVLFVRRGLQLKPMVRGGGQEHGLRAGTENVSAAVGLAEALKTIPTKENGRPTQLRDYFFSRIGQVMPDIRINGARGAGRLANNIHLSIPNLESEQLLLELDKHGIAAGSGSACTARSVEPSHVLKAIGVRKPYLDGALRFTLGRGTTRQDINELIRVLPRVVKTLRKRYGK